MSARRTYYTILGVTREESPAGVRSAFRDLARRHHPDLVGARGTAFFQDIVEAYQTLSDPERRADYNRGLDHVEGGVPVRHARPAPTPGWMKGRPTVEPLIPEPLLPEPVSLMRDFEVGRPSATEIFDRIQGSYTGLGQPKSRRLETLQIDVILRPETALRGGVLTIGVPVFFPCARCRGTGRLLSYACNACGQTGLVEEERPVHLQVAPGVRDGALYRLPLRGLGIHNLQLVVRVRVTPVTPWY